MKIIVDKYEFAKMIRACKTTMDGYGCTSKCVVSEICNGPEHLENMVEITTQEQEGIRQKVDYNKTRPYKHGKLF